MAIVGVAVTLSHCVCVFAWFVRVCAAARDAGLELLAARGAASGKGAQ